MWCKNSSSYEMKLLAIFHLAPYCTFSQMQRQHAELAVRCKTGEYAPSTNSFWVWEKVQVEWKEADAQLPGVSTAQPT